MDVCVPAPGRDWVLLYLVLAVTLWLSPVDGDGSSCTPSINVPRNVKFSRSEGEALTLQCPVRICSQEFPPVTWCRVDEKLLCDAAVPGNRIFSAWGEQEGNRAAYLLTFISLQVNDTGFYRCSAMHRGQQIVSGLIEVNITATSKTDDAAAAGNMTGSSDTVSTTASPNSVLYNYKLFLYLVIALGALCVLIIALSLLVVCVTRIKEKSRSSPDPVNAEEVVFIAEPENPKNCPHQTDVVCSSPLEAEFTAVSTEVTYDNAHLGYSRSTTLNAPETPTNEESIVYADLNHEAKRKTFQCEDGCDVEYSTWR
ncbi:uncharacterized protein LOC135050308 [Pseudophryne corroboree]|uniref:uncharacterized protein LOC135050308 n=1 Tax=Pseudophryne corroboree TaxID=495146 RepID=UPI003081F25C